MAHFGLVYNSALFQGGGVAAPTDDSTWKGLAGAATRLAPAGARRVTAGAAGPPLAATSR